MELEPGSSRWTGGLGRGAMVRVTLFQVIEGCEPKMPSVDLSRHESAVTSAVGLRQQQSTRP